MTRVKVTYIAVDNEGVPIASAETQEHLKEALDIYYGVQKGAAKCEGWFPFQTKYPDDYEGYYEYSWRMVLRDVIDEGKDMVKVYCIEFHPHTVYDIKQEQKKLITEVMNEDAADNVRALAKESWIPCDSCTPVDEQFYTSGFIAGYYKGQESQVTPELSDEEIEMAAPYIPRNAHDYYVGDRDGFIEGAKWYREQLKLKS